jgi:hypothetical protein
MPFQSSTRSGEVIEIYPGFAMRTLGRRDYKRDPKQAIKTVLAHCAGKGISVELDSTIRDFCESYDSGRGTTSDPDGSDALIALAVAILYREGLCQEAIYHADRNRRMVEGVIWGPAL